MRGRKSGKWVEEFERWLEDFRRNSAAEAPIPASRDIATKYGVVHTSVFRQLQRLERQGTIWKSESGRFYFPEARALIQKPRPIACLFRTIENWSSLYQEIMEGIAQRCQQQELGSLLWHEKRLVRHADPGSPPVFATISQQIKSLTRFIERYGNDIGGLILDHVWTDEAVQQLPQEIQKQTVQLCRPTTSVIPGIYPDFQMSANLALTHLFTAGYERIHPVSPFPNDQSVEHCLRSLHVAAQMIDVKSQMGDTLVADTPKARGKLLRSLAKTRHRTALLFPEDNVARLFWQDCQQAGIPCPDRIGILSLQGTRAAAQARISHVRIDYQALGRRAVEECLQLNSTKTNLTPCFVPGETTRVN